MNEVDKVALIFSSPMPTIRTAGYQSFDPVWAEIPHPAAGMEILHVVNGVLEEHVGDECFRAEPGDTLIIPSGAMHRDAFDPEVGLEVVFCSVQWRHEAAYLRHVDNAALLAAPPQFKAEMAALFDQLRTDLRGADLPGKLVAGSRVLTILSLALRETRRRRCPTAPRDANRGKQRRRELMERAKAWLREHCDRPVSLDEVASALHVSGYYLSHVFSGESNFSLFAYLTAVRMERAKALLAEGQLNVSQVAAAVGYRDPNYFSKAFRKQCGCAPTAYADALGPD